METQHPYKRYLFKLAMMPMSVLLLNISTYGQTIVKSEIIRGTWSLDNSPYFISCNVKIPADTGLMIEAGVLVKFTGPYSMQIEGILKAKGTNDLPVSFAMADSAELVDYSSKVDSGYTPPSQNWKGLRFKSLVNSSDTSILDHCIITSADATWGESIDCSGGAICVDGKRNLEIKNSFISRNRAIIGGALYCRGSDVLISNCIFSDNHSHSDGGGIYLSECKPLLQNNQIVKNRSNEFGGGVLCKEIYGRFINNIVTYNNARFGGAMALQNSDVYIANNTIVENQASVNGGGIHCDNSTPEIVNCILWANQSDNKVDQLYLYRNSQPFISRTCLQEGLSGIRLAKDMPGNIIQEIDIISSDPEFDKEKRAYYLAEGSPCIDAGNKLPKDQNYLYDVMGNPRICGEYIDLGAVEYQAQVKAITFEAENIIKSTSENETIISFYPNPSNGCFTISFKTTEGIHGILKIYNLEGKSIYTRKLDNDSNWFTLNVMLDMPRGEYLAELSNNLGEIIRIEKIVLK
jgi:hypothetical protein